MGTQSIVVQVGQCGNQIGCQFWDLALREHASVSKDGIFDEAMSTFFRNVDTRVRPMHPPKQTHVHTRTRTYASKVPGPAFLTLCL